MDKKNKILASVKLMYAKAVLRKKAIVEGKWRLDGKTTSAELDYAMDLNGEETALSLKAPVKMLARALTVTYGLNCQDFHAEDTIVEVAEKCYRSGRECAISRCRQEIADYDIKAQELFGN